MLKNLYNASGNVGYVNESSNERFHVKQQRR